MTRTPSRILVVDDEENVSYVTVAALRLAGFEASSVSSGEAALKAMQSDESPDLMVLDVMLPDIDGFELCRRLGAWDLRVPVVFLTARDAVDERVRGLTIGGDDYLTKPFSVEELVARVRVVLRRTGQSTDSRLYQFSDLVMDDDSHIVTRAGHPVDLSPTEYKLLRFLLRNGDKVTTRAQILDHVWSYDFSGESGVVDTFISTLRKKLDEFGPEVIQTVRGVGYRMGTRSIR